MTQHGRQFVPEGPSPVARGVSLWFPNDKINQSRRGERELLIVVRCQIADKSRT